MDLSKIPKKLLVSYLFKKYPLLLVITTSTELNMKYIIIRWKITIIVYKYKMKCSDLCFR